jgi:hypothetical protein
MQAADRFLKLEKKRRNRVCKQQKGKRGEYDPDIDVFEYDSLQQLIAKKPFRAPFGDCIESEPGSEEKDAHNRYYSKVRTEVQCDDVEGIWKGKAQNRVNKRDDGVCWVNEDDARCAEKYERESNAKSKCNADDTCKWAFNECYSRRSFDALPAIFPDDWPKDVIKEDIQQYLSEYFSSGDYRPPKHLSLFGMGNRCTAKELNKNTLSLPQVVVNSVMKGMAKHPESSNRGLLVWHSTGSGKTCTATGVIDAFWETNKNIVFVTSVEASSSNPPSNFHKCAHRFFPRFANMTLEKVKSSFEKRKVQFFTFAQLAHFLLIANPLKRVKKPEDIERHKNFLNNAVIIIDEVHNIFKPLPNQRLENNAVRKFLADYGNKRTTNLNVVILTATPGNTSDDIVALLNLVRDRKAPPITPPNTNDVESMQKFTRDIRGLVSYFDMSKDYTKFPRVVYQKEKLAPMSMKQFVKYVEAYNGEPSTAVDYDSLSKKDALERYYKKSRKYSNMLYNFEKDILINEFSSKVPLLLNTIAQYPREKHYVYSAFFERRGFGGQGIPAIAKLLEQELGYKKMSVAEARKFARAIEAGEDYPKEKRYVLALSADLSADRENLNALVKAYNTARNVNGEYIHVFLASQGYNEGVDLKAVRHIHIFEPLLSLSAEQQTVGRAARFCSHSDLTLQEWNVQIHRYLSSAPLDMSAFNDNYIRDRIDNIQIEITEAQERLTQIKGAKGPTAAKAKEDIKKFVAAKKADIRKLQSKKKEIEKMNLKHLQMIDEQIMNERFEKVKELMAVYDIIRKQAIDYLLLKDFHESSASASA